MVQRILLFVIVILTVLSTGGIAHAQDMPLPQPVPNQIFLPLTPNQMNIRSDLPIGVQMFGSTGRDTVYFDALQRSNANWLRVELHWRLVEWENTTPDKYFWRYADKVVAAAQDAGVTIILTHQSNPVWAATSANGPVDIAPLSEVVEYLAAVVERYDGDGVGDAPGSPVVRYFELYDELDYGGTDQDLSPWHDERYHYGYFLEAVYPAVKQANPDSQVIFGGMSHEMVESGESLLIDVLASGRGHFFDMLGLHIVPSMYRIGGYEGVGVLDHVTAVRKLLEAYRMSKPIIITKAWANRDDMQADLRPTYLTNQARYLVKVLTHSLGADVEAAIWYKLYDRIGNPQESGLTTPLLDGTEKDKPLMLAFRTFMEQMNGTLYQGHMRWEVEQNVVAELHQFGQEGQTVYVAWLNLSTDDPLSRVTFAGQRAAVVDMMGQPIITIADDDGDGEVEVEIGAAPRYIRIGE